jgi:hypothetical protein
MATMTARKGKHCRIAWGPFRRVRRFVIVHPLSREEDATWLPVIRKANIKAQ